MLILCHACVFFFFFQAEDGIRDLVRSRGLGDVYKRQVLDHAEGNMRQVTYDLEVSNSHGRIAFDGATDLAKVNIDDVVVLKYQEIEMYPAPQTLPVEGEALNKPATISLYNMKPEFKGESVPSEKFGKMLKKSNQKQGATFVSYEETADHGWVWTFKMNNFNRATI
eukprot:TRINITY_DN4392_c0_g2_i17.p1 TRINITY_DN4392_c0_g2~~TRINITY_DN4392_c0_g2_i17.p1  ORF type:complete len:167 (+),score=63.20 TRINITY_DN4392_c0_g2_i17:26-526(+)